MVSVSDSFYKESSFLCVCVGGGAGVSHFSFTKNPNLKKSFCFGEMGGGRARVSNFFY